MWAVSQQHPDVVKVLLAHGADVSGALGRLERGDGGAAARLPPVQPSHPARRRNRADVRGARRRSRVGEAPGGGRRQRRTMPTRGASAPRRWPHTPASSSWSSSCSRRAPTRMPRAPGFTALHEAIMRRDERMVGALLAHGADANAPLRTWTPTRRSSDDFNFVPELVGATPFWLAARFDEPERHAPAGEARRRSAVRPPRRSRRRGQGGDGFQHRAEATTALMAAVGMGGGEAWVQPERGEREALTLEAVKLAGGVGRRRQCRQYRRPHGARCGKDAEIRYGRQVSRREGGEAWNEVERRAEPRTYTSGAPSIEVPSGLSQSRVDVGARGVGEEVISKVIRMAGILLPGWSSA